MMILKKNAYISSLVFTWDFRKDTVKRLRLAGW